jgi:tetratricopeptide (TPR) repeat protein
VTTALADDISTPAAPARGGRALRAVLATAAIGCAALGGFWVYNGGSMNLGGGNPALGALQQLPAAAPTAPAQPTSEPSAEPAAPSAPSSVAANAALVPTLPTPTPRTPGSARSSDSARASDADTDAESDVSRAQRLVNEGTALLRQGRLGLAESSYQKALALIPEFPSAMAALVRVHLVRRDGVEAVRWANRLVAKQNNGESQLLLGDALSLRGDADAAREAWTAAANRGNATARQRLQE